MATLAQPFVSVVTPFYNTEAFLKECIESVLAQSYKNFEYILVDNCSNDGSMEIVKRYAERDSRIHVLQNQMFLRQIENYNCALRAISDNSLYCKIVQADDWLYPSCLSEMVKVAEANPSVGIVGAYTLLDFGTHSNVYLSGLPYPSASVRGRDLCRRFLLDGTYVTGSPTATLFRSEIVRSRNPFYDTRSVVCDIEVCFDVLQSWDFGFVHQVLTYTRRYNDSYMSMLKHLHVMTLTEVIAIRKYGPIFLEEEEYRRRRRRIERKYHKELGESLLRRQPKAFWDFQRYGVAGIGEELHWTKLVVWGLLALLDFVLNPKATVERLLRYKRKSATTNFSKIEQYVALNQDTSNNSRRV
jgi:glycosyltransferase involved in cell wall biosynthesis